MIYEQKIRYPVGWVETDPISWISHLNPTIKNQAFIAIQFQKAKPNNSIRRVCVQPL